MSCATTVTTCTSLLYVAGVLLLFLLKASRIEGSSSCKRTIQMPAPDIDEDTLAIRYTSRMVTEGNWTLDALVTWERPKSDFKAYALKLTLHKYVAHQYDCDEYSFTVNESYTFKNLAYGEKYELEIRKANTSPSSISRLEMVAVTTRAPGGVKIDNFINTVAGQLDVGSISVSFDILPDCYEETRDREFCQRQSITTFSKVVDIRLDCIIRNAKEPASLTAYISWLPPIQVNKTLTNFTDVELTYKVSENKNTYGKWEMDLRGVTEDELLGWPYKRYVSDINDLTEGINYTLQLKLYAGEDFNEPTSFQFNTLNLSSHQMAQRLPVTSINACYTMLSTERAYTPNTTLAESVKAEQRLLSNETTLVVLIIMSILVLLAMITLILCYLRRRAIPHISKQGVFGRFSDEAGTPHKSPETEALRQKATTFLDGGDREHDINYRGEVWQTVQSSLAVNIFYEPHSSTTPRENDPIFQCKEFDRSFLNIEDKLGSGQFGVVYKGYAFGIDGTDKYALVAVKSLRPDATDTMKSDFLDEIKLIIEIGTHPNILPILGCCTTEEPYYLITEFMMYGDLLRFLLRCREQVYQGQDNVYKVTKRGQLQIARQIARGMEYLSSTRYYHGDLAARNVLVGEGLVIKISDFGMANDIYQQGYKRLAPERKRPVKWVSLETNTRGQCTIQSDVWSFGIVLYEIYTFGDVPYPGLDGRDVVKTLIEGFRMDKPDNCPNEIYEIMLQCWHENPYDRPSFTELYTRLDDMLSQSSDYICDLENHVRYHPDTFRTFGLQSSPMSIGSRPLPPDPFQVVVKSATPPTTENSNIGLHHNGCREFEIDECTC